MQSSLFPQIVEKYLSLVVGKITEKYNDKSQESALLYRSMLQQEYSPDLSWASTTLNHSIVAADVVALDSSLPLKKRDVITTASGKVAKIGVKYHKTESDITNLNIMIARGGSEATLAAKVLEDTTKAVKAIHVRNEILFEEALSSGECLVANNDGVEGVRVSFGYLDENQFKALTKAWGDTAATPIDDIEQMFTKANEDGNSIGSVYLSKDYFNKLRKSEQAKILAATYSGYVITNAKNLPTPTNAVMLAALADEFGVEFHLVDGSFKTQSHDGTNKTVKPWVQANVVAVPSDIVGRFVYGTLAEETNPVEKVSYTKSDSFILLSKYSTTDPLVETTAGQAICLPVIDDASSIYVLHADEVQS
jgi:hypothetical protein